VRVQWIARLIEKGDFTVERKPQTYLNHTKWDPPFHFFLGPFLMIVFGLSIWNVIREDYELPAWVLLALSFGTLILTFKTRLYALKVQDRVIRLEERLRLMRVLPERLRPRVEELTESQVIALRFASDAELSGLVEKALAGSSNADIKKAIVNWRPDYYRA
jgi:hypothetical protein